MQRLSTRHLLQNGAVLVLLLLGVLATYAWYSFRRPLPQTDGALTVDGLRDEVVIYRDAWGVPHIYANNVHDLFFAQGYIHAQDRWWQMEMNRRLGSGRLSAIIGDNTAVQNTDRFIRALGWGRIAADAWQDAPPSVYQALTAYTAGVNGYIAEEDQGDLAVQYTILGLSGRGFAVLPWEPVDSLAWLTAYTWMQSGNFADERAALHLLNALGDDLLHDLGYATDFDYRVLNGALIDALDPINLAFMPFGGGARGDAWVVGGSRTDSGLPLLTVDVQQAISIPVRWYEVGLHCIEVTPACPYSVVGMSLAGVPGVVMGYNADIAWALADPLVDTQDLSILRLNPQLPTQYELDGAWQPMIVHHETIPVNNADPLEVRLYAAEWGAVVSRQPNSPYALALQWIPPQPAQVLAAFLQVNTAANWEDFLAALQNWAGPPQHVFYADRSGNIGRQTVGSVPVRGHDGSLPLPAWQSANLWQGTQPAATTPPLFNPPVAWIATDSPRLQDLLLTIDQHSADTFANIQADTYSPFAARVLAALLAIDTALLPADENGDELRDYQNWLREWDATHEPDSPYPLLFNMFWVRLIEAVFDDQLEDGLMHPQQAILPLLENPNSRWWDDLRTPEIEETRDETLLNAFALALDDAKNQWGMQRQRWRWGDLHTARFTSIPLGDSGVAAIEELLNREVPAAGSFDTFNVAPWNTTRANRYQVLSLPVFRMIIDLDSFAHSRSILATGQSGHPASPHYDDMMPLWGSVAYRNMQWEANALREASASTLRLRPQP